ncbi:MAG: Cu(I)-responsive transcriptional regulator [Alphaproteobacteria bacterium]
MNIGEVAQAVDLPVKTVRYYEEIGLVVPERQANGYRRYREREVHVLRFLRRARGLGFSISDCRALLSLYGDEGRASADVRRLAEARIGEIDRKMAELASLRATLASLVGACHGDDHPDCPILDDLSGDADGRVRGKDHCD